MKLNLVNLQKKIVVSFHFSMIWQKKENLDNLLFRRYLIIFVEKGHCDLKILINNAGIQYNYHFLEAV